MVVDPPPPRTRAGALFMAAPLAVVGVIALAFGALVFLIRTGGVADGERIQATLSTTCAAASAPILEARMAAIGLGEPVLQASGAEVVLTLTLPSTETSSRTIPEMLARRGLLVMETADGQVRAKSGQITGSGVEIDNAGMPTTLVQLTPDARSALEEGLKMSPPITVRMDGEAVTEFTRLPDLDDGYLELPSGEGITSQRMRVAADRAILLSSGPLPCAAQVTQVVSTSAPG